MLWTDKLVLEFAIVAQKGAYGRYEGLHKIEEKLKKFKLIHSIPPGAPKFFAEGTTVVMYEDGNTYGKQIDNCANDFLARNLADLMQRQANAYRTKVIKNDKKLVKFIEK